MRDAVEGRAAVWAKLNMADGFRGGLELADALEVARLIEVDASVDALQLTGGFTGRTPMFPMRGDVPLRELLEAERHPLRRLGLRLVAPRLMRAWAFEEAFFRPYARQFVHAVRLPVMLLGGITRLDTVRQAMADGFAMVAMARALLRDPDLVRQFQRGQSGESLCVHGNQCVAEMERAGTRCVLAPTNFDATGA